MSSIETQLSMIEARVKFSSFDWARLKLEAQWSRSIEARVKADQPTSNYWCVMRIFLSQNNVRVKSVLDKTVLCESSKRFASRFTDIARTNEPTVSVKLGWVILRKNSACKQVSITDYVGSWSPGQGYFHFIDSFQAPKNIDWLRHLAIWQKGFFELDC